MMKQLNHFIIRQRSLTLTVRTTFILSLCLLFSTCATHYKSYYVAPSYFFTLPQSKQRVSKELVVVHGPEKSYYLLHPNMNDSVISGKPALIEDTSSQVYKQTLEFAESNHSSPVFLYTYKSDSTIQREIVQDSSKQLKLLVSDLKSVRFKPNQMVSSTQSISSPKKPSSNNAGTSIVIFFFGIVLMVMVVIITLQMLAQPKCYIATMVYKSYDAPEVLVLRKFRDEKLLPFWWGKGLVALYYFTSPLFVKAFRNNARVNSFCKTKLDQLVKYLQANSRNQIKSNFQESMVS